MRLKYLYHLLIGKTDASHPAKFTFRNIWAVIQAFFRKQKRIISGFELDEHIYEQIVWRRTQVMTKSPQCWHLGSCKVCGCEILGKTMEDRACAVSEHSDILKKRDPCYPAMMTASEWSKYKISKNIKIFK